MPFDDMKKLKIKKDLELNQDKSKMFQESFAKAMNMDEASTDNEKAKETKKSYFSGIKSLFNK